jgi:hypothetical protein
MLCSDVSFCVMGLVSFSHLSSHLFKIGRKKHQELVGMRCEIIKLVGIHHNTDFVIVFLGSEVLLLLYFQYNNIFYLIKINIIYFVKIHNHILF